jgi:hypothetical protein
MNTDVCPNFAKPVFIGSGRAGKAAPRKDPKERCELRVNDGGVKGKIFKAGTARSTCSS